MRDGGSTVCRQCGFGNDGQARFCEDCGANLQEGCPNCGAALGARQKFCRACGEPLGAVRAGLSKLETPEHLANRISPAEAERKIATVLFADIANSTEIIRDFDAEEARRLLVPTVKIMADAVHHYQGIVIRDRGDGIMASFGAPLALEDHAVMACYAALDMQQAIRVRANEVARDIGLPLEVRIGINSGPVVVTVKYEAGKVRDIRVDGVPTHIAARLEPLARPGSILLSRDTVALAEGFVRVTRDGRLHPQGHPGSGAGLPARGREHPDAHPCAGRARHVEVRRSSARDRDAAPRGGAGAGRTRPGRRPRGRGRCRQVPRLPGVHPFPADAGMAGTGGGVGVLRQSHLVSAAGRPPDPVFRHPFPRRRTAGTGQGRREVVDFRRGAAAGAGPVLSRHSGSGAEQRRLDEPLAPGAPAHDDRCAQATPDPGVAKAAALSGLRGSALDRHRDPGIPRNAAGQHPRGAVAAARQLPARVSEQMGREELFLPGAHRSAAAGERRRDARRPARLSCRARPDQASADRRYRGQSVVPRGERAQPDGVRRAARQTRSVAPAGIAARGLRPAHDRGAARGAYRSPAARAQGNPAVRRRDRRRHPAVAAAGRGRDAAAGHRGRGAGAAGRGVPVREDRCFPRMPIPSSTP